jgi:predicted permease
MAGCVGGRHYSVKDSVKSREQDEPGVRFLLLDDISRDVRQALRALRRSVGFTLTAVLTLGVGIGAATAMFSVLDGVLLRSLPVQREDEVVVLRTSSAARSTEHLPVLHRDVVAFGELTRTLQALAGVSYYGAGEQVLLDRGAPLVARATWVTGDFFTVLGVVPVLGRTLLPDDDVPGVAGALVISHGMWQRQFGGDPAVIGRALQRDGRDYTIVGVVPRGFAYPQGADVWLPALHGYPATLEADASPASIIVFDVVGRLTSGAGVDAAEREYGAFLRATDAERSAAVRGLEPVVVPLTAVIAGDAGTRVWTAGAAALLLLMIVCGNVANLLLVRSAAQSRDLAIRRALGARHGRLVRQLLTESAVLAAVGGAVGVGLAYVAVDVLGAVAPADLPRRELITIDGRVLLFAVAITAATALLVGLLPALQSTRPAATPLRGSAGGAESRAARTTRQALVVAQVALAVLVAAGAGLVVRSFIALQQVEMGFTTERLLVVAMTLPSSVAPERPARIALQEAIVERVRALPGVAAAATLPARPFSGRRGWDAMYTAEGQSNEKQASNPWVNFEVVGTGYFTTLQMPVRRGRAFTAADNEDATRVAIISGGVARHSWPGEDPIGRRIKLGAPDGPAEWHTVVGVVDDTRYRELAHARPSLYLPIRQFGGPVPMTLAVRSRESSATLLPTLRAALAQVHPELILVSGARLRELMAEPLARPRFSALLLGTFGAAILLLAALGIYGVITTIVRQRTREIGVRVALGAHAGQIAAMVVRQGLALVALGTAAGLVAAFAATRLLRSLLFDVSPTDPGTLVAVVGLLFAIGVAASWPPARRAARVDPVTTLRAQ